MTEYDGIVYTSRQSCGADWLFYSGEELSLKAIVVPSVVVPQPEKLSNQASLDSKEDTVKTLAFGMTLVIMAVGAVGVVVPSGLVWIAQHSLTSGAFYVIATARVVFGLVLISVVSVSRAPRMLRVLGYLILIAGITTALTTLMGLVGMERARAIIEWWARQGSGVVRLTGAVVLALGGFVAYACAPARRAA